MQLYGQEVTPNMLALISIGLDAVASHDSDPLDSLVNYAMLRVRGVDSRREWPEPIRRIVDRLSLAEPTDGELHPLKARAIVWWAVQNGRLPHLPDLSDEGTVMP